MPSDTAALAFALAAVAWSSSRRLGAAAVAWAAVVTCLPRLYIGYHYLSDLLVGVGAAVGGGRLARAAARGRRRPRVGARARAPAVPLAFFVLGAECLHVFESTPQGGGRAASWPERSPRGRPARIASGRRGVLDRRRRVRGVGRGVRRAAGPAAARREGRAVEGRRGRPWPRAEARPRPVAAGKPSTGARSTGTRAVNARAQGRCVCLATVFRRGRDRRTRVV
jgi:hypothetical protein